MRAEDHEERAGRSGAVAAVAAARRCRKRRRQRPKSKHRKRPKRELPSRRCAGAAAAAIAEGRSSGLGDGSSIRVSTEKIDELMNTVGELVITQSMLSQLGAKVAGAAAEQLRSGLAQLERNMRELQESVMRVRMLPISFVFSRFPRMVRDLSQRLGKQVELKMTGDQTELDKTVMEKIGDPLVHLVRNSVDHGIEMPDVRTAAGKRRPAPCILQAYHKGGNIIVEVGDDGGGLSKDSILAKARERGLIGPNDTLSDDADLQADLRAGLLHGRADHRHLRPRRRHGRGAPQHQGAGRHDRSALDAGQGLALHHHAAADARDPRRPVG